MIDVLMHNTQVSSEIDVLIHNTACNYRFLNRENLERVPYWWVSPGVFHIELSGDLQPQMYRQLCYTGVSK